MMTDLPKGIQKITNLPDAELRSVWESIILDDLQKKQLLSQAVLNFSIRKKISRSTLPLHGVILLVGPPGTGKTSLAKGLASKTASAFNSKDFRFVEVEAHGLTSSAMGKTQRAVSDLFSQSIAEIASQGPTIVLLDEVETLAVDRSKLSLDANPIDIHRATDAVLVQLDMLAESHKDLLFLATSNFPEAVDSAFLSRADLVMDVPLPTPAVCKKILQECISGLAETFPKMTHLTTNQGFDKCAHSLVGLDGRAIRKTVANALACRPEVALDPELVSIEDITNAAEIAVRARRASGGNV